MDRCDALWMSIAKEIALAFSAMAIPHEFALSRVNLLFFFLRWSGVKLLYCAFFVCVSFTFVSFGFNL